MGWVLSHQLLIKKKKKAPQTCLQVNLVETLSQLSFLLPSDSSLCQADLKPPVHLLPVRCLAIQNFTFPQLLIGFPNQISASSPQWVEPHTRKCDGQDDVCFPWARV